MNAKQEAKLTMYRTVEQHCNANSAITGSVAAFNTAFTEFKARVAEIIGTEQLAETNLTGITVDKGNSKQNLAGIAVEIAGVIFAFASETKNSTLKQEVNVSLSTLSKTRDEQLAPRCQLIHDRAVQNEIALKDYGVTTDKTAALQAAITNYLADSPKPRTAVSQRKTLKSNLMQTFRNADGVLKERMDKLVLNFRAANPDFVKTYQSARIIIDAPTTATQLKGTVTNKSDGTPIKSATVTIVELAKTATTDSQGKYSFKPVQIGKFTVRVSASGLKDIEIDNFDVKLGESNNLGFELTAI